MRNILILYILSIVIIVSLIFFHITRNTYVSDYRSNFFNDTGKIKYIPKKIFQLVQDKNNINENFQKNINFLKSKNPSWKYTLYDDNDMIEYIKTYYGDEILRYYKKINPKYGAARADFFRYLLMYREGGVYLDIKSAVIYPLDNVILPDDEYLLSYWDTPIQFHVVGNPYGEFQQWHIICRPKHPFLYEVINDVMHNIKMYNINITGVGKDAVLRVTGPIAYSKAILKVQNLYGHRIIYLNEYIGLVYNNIQKSHIDLFSKTHYSKIQESVIIND